MGTNCIFTWFQNPCYICRAVGKLLEKCIGGQSGYLQGMAYIGLLLNASVTVQYTIF
jgi:hypothetical protein